ncbi:MAG: hypothetical protein R3D51_10910 [Hyphomicrobiaceae bacterium]
MDQALEASFAALQSKISAAKFIGSLSATAKRWAVPAWGLSTKNISSCEEKIILQD